MYQWIGCEFIVTLPVSSQEKFQTEHLVKPARERIAVAFVPLAASFC